MEKVVLVLTVLIALLAVSGGVWVSIALAREIAVPRNKTTKTQKPDDGSNPA